MLQSLNFKYLLFKCTQKNGKTWQFLKGCSLFSPGVAHPGDGVGPAQKSNAIVFFFFFFS
jgi:hypothetical protein